MGQASATLIFVLPIAALRVQLARFLAISEEGQFVESQKGLFSWNRISIKE